MEINDTIRQHSLAQFYKSNETMVHVKLKGNQFYNGFITKVEDISFVIDDREVGKILVFFEDLYKPIQPYKLRRVGNGE